MPGTISPSQMYEHELNPVKGWPSPYAVDFTAEISASETNTINGGAVCYLDANGEFRLGGGTGNEVCIFVFDPLNADVGNITGSERTGLPAVVAYEVQTTEFVSSQDYTPNTFLTPATGDDLGKVTVGTPYTNKICGIVSKGVVTNEYGIDVLQFWTYHLPASS